MVFKANPGGKDHLKAKERNIKLLEARGFSCEKEVEFKEDEIPGLGRRSYTADTVATLKIIVETDGETHWSKAAIHKDKIRDEYFKTQHIPTLRLPQDVKYDDVLLMKEFLHQVWGLKIA